MSNNQEGADCDASFDDEPKDDENNESNNNDKNEDHAIARNENRAVLRSKVLVLAVISICAVSFGIVAYFISAKDEQDDFEVA
jgi:hypothetical protein